MVPARPDEMMRRVEAHAGTRRSAAVLGYPIGHSLSPVLHTAAYRALGLEGWSYRPIECTRERFPDWFAGLRAAGERDAAPWVGLSLTMPLKQVVLPLLDEVSELAASTGSANTVTWDDAGRSHGENTDVPGIVQALASIGVTEAATGCVLGAGATAASAVAALARLGCTAVTVRARSAQRSIEVLELAARLGMVADFAPLEHPGPDPALQADVVVCTLPAAAGAAWAERVGEQLGSAASRPPGGLLDVSYDPWPPAAVQVWEKHGGTAVGGFEMLLHQAAEQVRLMTGHEAPLAVMRAAGEAELGR